MTEELRVVKAESLPDDLQKCIAFHGHLCPGVVIGYCASKLAMRLLAAGRAEDEEMIAIVENDTCAVDAVQWLTGCTFGKGNFYFHDYGKMVFTFATRPSGRSVRLRYLGRGPAGVDGLPDDQRRARQVEFMLSVEPSELFEVRENTLQALPERASLRDSMECDECGEHAMASRTRAVQGRTLCVPCSRKYQCPGTLRKERQI